MDRQELATRAYHAVLDLLNPVPLPKHAPLPKERRPRPDPVEFTVTPEHPSLPGHFPGRPIVPGVVILDHVLAAIEARDGVLGPVRLPQVKFVQPLLPGEDARIELDGQAPRWRFRVLREDVLLASGEVVRS